MSIYHAAADGCFRLLKGDCAGLLRAGGLGPFDMVFADPPYFLSNGGFSVQAGKRVSVNKGAWDRSRGR